MADVMKPSVTGEEWACLTLAERIARCEACAREAERLAELSPKGEERFREAAAQWRALADEFKRM